MAATISAHPARRPPVACNHVVPVLPYIALVLAVGLLDHFTGWWLSVIAFYPIPIALATWRLGGGAGLITVVVTTAVWLTCNFTSTDRPPEATTASIFWNGANRVALFLVVWFLVGQMRALLFRQSRLLSCDGLTGLESRQVFMRNATAALTAARQTGKPAALLLVDVDQLRVVNGRFGQQRGDMVLLAVARSMWSSARREEHDLVARLGNDEFALLMPGATAEQAQQRAERLRTIVRENPATSSDGVTVSTVLITAPVAPASIEPLLQAAEDAAAQAVIVGPASAVHRTLEAQPA